MQTVAVERVARERYGASYSESQNRANRFETYHKFYAPAGGDQWPEDLAERPGKLHFTVNIVRAFVDTEARLLSIPPRIIIPPDFALDDATSKRAEACEKLFDRYLEHSGFEQWSYTFNQVKSLYGVSILKPFWNDESNMPDVSVVEQPQNMMFGWGDSNFQSIDWAIYHYQMSRLQAKMKYPNLSEDDLLANFEPSRALTTGGNDHSDPVQTLSFSSRLGRQIPEYERTHVSVWDYWYLEDDGTVMNAVLVNGKLADGPFTHGEMPVIPYIPVESDHEPGSPDGHGIAELVLDLQMGLNRAISHYAQHVWDTTDPAYQLTGAEAPMQVPPGLVPLAGQIVAPGPNARIEEIRSGVNNFPFDALIQRYQEIAYRITGLSEILFGAPPSAQTSGRALQAQLDSSINRLDPKRHRYYDGLRGLLQFWHYMVSQKNPVIDGIKAKDVLQGLNNWKIIAPEITPKDVMEHTQNVMQKVNSKLVSLETGMDELGVDNPLEEIKKIMQERSNAHLFPGDAQAIAAVVATLQAIAAQQQQGAQGAAAQGQNAQNAAVQDQQQAQPTLTNDQNQGLPATGPGGPPPPGGPVPGGIGATLEPMVRQAGTGNASPMSQIVLPKRAF